MGLSITFTKQWLKKRADYGLKHVSNSNKSSCKLKVPWAALKQLWISLNESLCFLKKQKKKNQNVFFNVKEVLFFYPDHKESKLRTGNWNWKELDSEDLKFEQYPIFAKMMRQQGVFSVDDIKLVCTSPKNNPWSCQLATI